MADTTSGSDAVGSTSDSCSTRLPSRRSWRLAVESISSPDCRATTSSGWTSRGVTSATTRPWRSTTMRSASSNTWSSWWRDQQDGGAPGPQLAAPGRSTWAVSLRPSEAVGSSRISSAGSPLQRPGDGDGLALPARQGGHRPAQVGDVDADAGPAPAGPRRACRRPTAARGAAPARGTGWRPCRGCRTGRGPATRRRSRPGAPRRGWGASGRPPHPDHARRRAGRSRAMHLASVDLPAPLSPTSATTSPAATRSDAASSTCSSPNRFDRPRTSSSGTPGTGGGPAAEWVAGRAAAGAAGG